ncbi:MAG: hypothetical protein IIC91_05420 [Chloroflexi bacterium]|nr:hypothetical protein [Chloroflexota bacterium]MCH8161666.1 hypothetical protein [Chloroflexota bacterium]
MHVRRVNGRARDTDLVIRPILGGMSPEEHAAYLSDMRQRCEARMKELERLVSEAEIRSRRAAVEYDAREQIFASPELTELAEEAGKAQAEVQQYRKELNDLFSLVLFCKEELQLQITRTSSN